MKNKKTSNKIKIARLKKLGKQVGINYTAKQLKKADLTKI